MNLNKSVSVRLENDTVFLDVDPLGGAITAFQLKGNDINPLSFKFSQDQMPANNKAGANYQGHFVCLGRWGPPSGGEIQAGLPDHGEPANIEWTIKQPHHFELEMHTVAAQEGLQVERSILLDAENPVCQVKEIITNINPLGRLFNIVQHPSLAAPFLDKKTLVDCNGLKGFDQARYKSILNNEFEWPMARDGQGNNFNLRNPAYCYSTVYSFVVKQTDLYGWITAFSPTCNLLLGYVWERAQYPWIHLWQHFSDDKIQYRGLEFGTAGIHQPFKEILDTATTIFGENTYAYIDAGETINKNYFSFLLPVNEGFPGVDDVYFDKNELVIKAKSGGENFNIKLTQKLTDELPG